MRVIEPSELRVAVSPGASMCEAFGNPMPRCACDAGSSPHHQLTV